MVPFWVRCCSYRTQQTWLSLLPDLVLRYMLTLMTISCISANLFVAALECCVTTISHFMSANRLKLNMEKTE